MVLAEFIAEKFGRGRVKEMVSVLKTEPKYSQINQFVVGFQIRSKYAINASPLSQTQLEAIADKKTGEERFDLEQGYIKVINKVDPDGVKVGIYIDDVWIDGGVRSYRLLTTAVKEKGEGEVYFAEYYDDKGQRKLKDRQINTSKATVEADRVLNLAIVLASEPRKSS